MRLSSTEQIKERIKKAFDYYGGDGIGIVPETAVLRIEQPLLPGTGKYRFDIRKDQSILGAAERSLSRSDLFVVTHIHVGLVLEEVAKPGQAPVLTYPMLGAAVMPAGLKGFATRDVEGLYNGGLSIKANQLEVVSDFPLINFRYVPKTQPQLRPYVASAADTNAAAGTAKTITNTVAYASVGQLPSFDLTDVALPLAEEIVFAGNLDNKIEINFPCANASNFKEFDDNANSTALFTPKAVLQVFGYKIPNGADSSYKVQKNPYFGRF